MINTNLEKKHFPYPAIAQFRNVIKNVITRAEYLGKDEQGEPIYDSTIPKPILSFIGTTKLHGTNAGIIINPETKEIYFQSHYNIITPTKDNEGFATFASHIQDKLIAVLDKCYITPDPQYSLVGIYGEWCGQGIQKGVAISQLPKMFVVFNIALIDPISGDKKWLTLNIVRQFRIPEEKIYTVYDFTTWVIDIDFNNPQLKQNNLIALTEAVEKQCPVGETFGVKGVGEGIVWKCITPGYENSGFWMKIKGEKHQTSGVKTLAPVNVEVLNNAIEFAQMAITESRLLQALSYLKEQDKPLDRTSLSDFIRWINNDIIKEDLDQMVENGLDIKSVSPQISKKIREWFFTNENNFENLI